MKKAASRKPKSSTKSPEGDALVALLALWTRVGGNDPKTDADLVHAIELAGERAARGKALGGKPGDWLAAAKRGDPVERGLLLATVEEAPRDQIIRRWAALVPFDDPRVTGKLAQRPAPVRVKAMLLKYLGLLVDAARDRRIVDAIGAIKKQKVYDPSKVQMIDRTQKRIRTAHRAAAKASTPPTADERALIASTIAADRGAREGSAQRESELLAAVYASPSDDGPRSVYADWLLERNDPRGEFIALQLASESRSLTKAERAREQELLSAHRRAWLGPLAALPIEIRFKRGFPCWFDWYEDLDLPDDPRWSTVEVAERMPPRSGLRALQRLTRATSKDLARLGELPPDSPLEQLVWHYPKPDKARDAAIAAYRKAKLPSLRSLDIKADLDKIWEPSRIGWVFEGRSLTDVAVPGDQGQLAAYFELFEKYAPTLESLGVDSRLGSCSITRPEGKKFDLYMSASQTEAIESALAGLEQLPPNLLGGAKISTTSKAPRIKDRFVAALARHSGCKLEYGR